MEFDAHAVARAVEGCPDVARLSGGAFGDVATYLPGARVVGVRRGEAGVEVHVVARWSRPLPEIGEQVRSAVRPLVDGQVVAVFIDDIETPAGVVASGA
jgi:hypothetical protein